LDGALFEVACRDRNDGGPERESLTDAARRAFETGARDEKVGGPHPSHAGRSIDLTQELHFGISSLEVSSLWAIPEAIHTRPRDERCCLQGHLGAFPLDETTDEEDDWAVAVDVELSSCLLAGGEIGRQGKSCRLDVGSSNIPRELRRKGGGEFVSELGGDDAKLGISQEQLAEDRATKEPWQREQ